MTLCYYIIKNDQPLCAMPQKIRRSGDSKLWVFPFKLRSVSRAQIALFARLIEAFSSRRLYIENCRKEAVRFGIGGSEQ